MRPIQIATRKSPLALWQAHYVADLLREQHHGLDVTFLEMTTEGDRFLEAPLSQIGGKGLFVKEIEQALIDGKAQVAVHSLKDMTSQLPPGLCITAVVHRDDVRDAWVSREGRKLAELPAGSKIGTSSLRRSCQLRAHRPDLEIVSVRGNVQTRLRKMEEEKWAGVVLAAAGLDRLELTSRVTEYFDTEFSLPAVGQGVLAVECHENDPELREMLSWLEDPSTRVAITAERAFLARLEGGCNVPLAAHAWFEHGDIKIRGLVGRPDGTKLLRGERGGKWQDAAELGRELAEDLLSRGAADILKDFAKPAGAPPL